MLDVLEHGLVVRVEGLPPGHCWRDCHFADDLSPSLLKHPLKGEGGSADRTTMQPIARANCSLPSSVIPPSRRRDCLSAAPPSTVSNCFI